MKNLIVFLKTTLAILTAAIVSLALFIGLPMALYGETLDAISFGFNYGIAGVISAVILFYVVRNLLANKNIQIR